MIESRHTSTSAMRDERKRRRRGFTLIELLMVLAIIGVLASVLLVSLYAAGQSAKVRRTKQQIERIHTLLMTRWESYQYRPLPIRTTGILSQDAWDAWYSIGCEFDVAHIGKQVKANDRAKMRLWAIRELMRLEFPERRTDVAPNVVGRPKTPGLERPSVWRSYGRRVARLRNNPEWYLADGWTTQHQGAECLYMILANIREGDRNGLDFFTEDEIGDVDNDRMPEILDGWGKPIEFLRWAPGFVGKGISDLQTGDMAPGMDGDSGDGGNILDPLKVDPLWKDGIGGNDPFTLIPLIFSAGPDTEYGILTEMLVGDPERPFRYTQDSDPYLNNPFHIHPSTSQKFGHRNSAFLDNISNHLLGQ